MSSVNDFLVLFTDFVSHNFNDLTKIGVDIELFLTTFEDIQASTAKISQELSDAIGSLTIRCRKFIIPQLFSSVENSSQRTANATVICFSILHISDLSKAIVSFLLEKLTYEIEHLALISFISNTEKRYSTNSSKTFTILQRNWKSMLIQAISELFKPQGVEDMTQSIINVLKLCWFFRCEFLGFDTKVKHSLWKPLMKHCYHSDVVNFFNSQQETLRLFAKFVQTTNFYPRAQIIANTNFKVVIERLLFQIAMAKKKINTIFLSNSNAISRIAFDEFNCRLKSFKRGLRSVKQHLNAEIIDFVRYLKSMYESIDINFYLAVLFLRKSIIRASGIQLFSNGLKSGKGLFDFIEKDITLIATLVKQYHTTKQEKFITQIKERVSQLGEKVIQTKTNLCDRKYSKAKAVCELFTLFAFQDNTRVDLNEQFTPLITISHPFWNDVDVKTKLVLEPLLNYIKKSKLIEAYSESFQNNPSSQQTQSYLDKLIGVFIMIIQHLYSPMDLFYKCFQKYAINYTYFLEYKYPLNKQNEKKLFIDDAIALCFAILSLGIF
ncbi:hypothetical protein QTN25_001349 [Entamoeba marina]